MCAANDQQRHLQLGDRRHAIKPASRMLHKRIEGLGRKAYIVEHSGPEMIGISSDVQGKDGAPRACELDVRRDSAGECALDR
jgi:hypothetical protein